MPDKQASRRMGETNCIGLPGWGLGGYPSRRKWSSWAAVLPLWELPLPLPTSGRVITPAGARLVDTLGMWETRS